MLFDTHAHYDSEEFDSDRYEVIENAHNSGVDIILNAATDIKSSMVSIELAEKYDFVYAAAGIHPHNALNDEAVFSKLIDLYENKKVIAVGEVGLDYYYDFKEKGVQKECFIRQINIAKEVGLPLIIHDRDSHKDVIDIIKSERAGEAGGVFHCFSGSKEMAKIVLDEGFYISFGGVITFKNAKKVIDVARYVPNDRILVETDCPYLTPEPYRGKRNDSSMVKFVVKMLSKIKNIDEAQMVDITGQNGIKLFGIKL